MSMSSHQDRVLHQISEQLAVSDPRLARRLSASVQPPTSTLREVAVMAVLLIWEILGFVPLALGMTYSRPVLVGVGMLTMLVVAPVLIMATLVWVRRHGFVRFRGSGSPASPGSVFLAAPRHREEG